MPDHSRRRRFVPPLDPNAEPVCRLTPEWAQARKEPPDAFLSAATAQETEEHGATFRFAATPGMWERIETFIAEERQCCPFFAFEQWEEGDELMLRIIQPQEPRT